MLIEWVNKLEVYINNNLIKVLNINFLARETKLLAQLCKILNEFKDYSFYFKKISTSGKI